MKRLLRPEHYPPYLSVLLVEMLIRAAVDAAHAHADRKEEVKPRPRSTRPRLTLRPGSDTPLWNELVRQIRPHLRKRGSKAQLARLLGLPRQRLQDCLKAGSASLDAERTLMLVGWLGFFQRGGELTPAVRSGGLSRESNAQLLPGSL